LTFVIVLALTIHAFLTKTDYTADSGAVTILGTSVLMMMLFLGFGVPFF
jgi:hypothetical protein